MLQRELRRSAKIGWLGVSFVWVRSVAVNKNDVSLSY